MWHIIAIALSIGFAERISDPNVWWIVGFVVFAELGRWLEKRKVKALEDTIKLLDPYANPH